MKTIIIMGKFEIKKDKAGKFRFNLKTANGQAIGTSQMYPNKSSMEEGIASVKKNAPKGKAVESL